MAVVIEVVQVQADLVKLIQEIRQGEEFLITQDGEPVARLIAAEPVLDRVPGSARGLFTVPDDFDDPLEDFRDYEPHATPA